TANSLPALIAPDGCAGSVAALMNCVNLLAGVAAPIVTGFVVDRTGSFHYAFIVGGFALLGGLLSFLLLMGRIEQIPPRPVDASRAAPPPLGPAGHAVPGMGGPLADSERTRHHARPLRVGSRSGMIW